MKLWHESEAKSPNGDLFAEGVFVTIVAVLLELRDREPFAGVEALQPISQPQLLQIKAYIDDNLDKRISNADLSRICGTPVVRFIRSFKAATGQTPYKYVLSRRIARAQELLATGDAALAEIAYACGFASQSHMTDVFRQKLRATPGRYRKEVQR